KLLREVFGADAEIPWITAQFVDAMVHQQNGQSRILGDAACRNGNFGAGVGLLWLQRMEFVTKPAFEVGDAMAGKIRNPAAFLQNGESSLDRILVQRPKRWPILV